MRPNFEFKGCSLCNDLSTWILVIVKKQSKYYTKKIWLSKECSLLFCHFAPQLTFPISPYPLLRSLIRPCNTGLGLNLCGSSFLGLSSDAFHTVVSFEQLKIFNLYASHQYFFIYIFFDGLQWVGQFAYVAHFVIEYLNNLLLPKLCHLTTSLRRDLVMFLLSPFKDKLSQLQNLSKAFN